ncbi:type II toxin-antitoxin system HicB family antitoxin [Clostridium botulinum]|uniref:type II toxin-antitoxin system HicB family antitoxin n=1 Tax=unclassified Clostridium TaxID=2614128 RepID=UPI0013CABCF0|nr:MULTISPECIES: type II toxin-antitoxin system HicB family antitoxin [unclassified Clostridium]MBY7008957.1 type II toxin-antitoxin system HicB family antitoxin [Clostridium botulinum]NFH73843.1 type II toxin-antitoxin system HicB family antitoxin [Clostridium botulinum]NFI02096.1 type II toxin-antitoxin system HicB family antitoxin [Clostridium botulinum]NFI64301.1 type II toxin-antitoxin system HicB family antitoxin [Clostridium botulinum]NFJ45094.1 type II toxin-antitoxin system HicB famil
MNAKDMYVFPAIFTYDNDGISIGFPDLPGCLSCADTTDEAIKMAKEALALHLYGMEEDNESIPKDTPINNLTLLENQIPMLIEVYMPLYRTAIENQSIKKTLTIPQWLNKLAEKNEINFSQILQAALKEQLGIHSTLNK